MIAFDSIVMKFSHQINSTMVNFTSPNSMEDKCLSDSLATNHFPGLMQTKSYRMRFKSPFSVISRRVLLILIRKPLGIKKHQNEHHLAVPIFIIKIVQQM